MFRIVLVFKFFHRQIIVINKVYIYIFSFSTQNQVPKIIVECRGGSRIFSRGGGGGGRKRPKKCVFRLFLKIFNQKIAFFSARAPPSKLVFIGAEGAFRKILGSVCQKWISQNSSKGGPFGSAGGRIPEGGRGGGFVRIPPKSSTGRVI